MLSDGGNNSHVVLVTVQGNADKSLVWSQSSASHGSVSIGSGWSVEICEPGGFYTTDLYGAPEWLSQLSVCLRLGSGPQGPGVESCLELPDQRGVCFPCTLPHSCGVSLSLSNE